MRTASVSVLDVGQGSCAIILASDQVGVVDCPPGGAATALAYLDDEFGPGPITIMIASHRDLDHVGGFPELLRNRGADLVVLNRAYAMPESPQEMAKVKAVLYAIIDHIEQHGVGYGELIRGQEVLVGTIRIRCLWPDQATVLRGTLGGDPNQGSMVLMVEADDSKFLLTGDLVHRGTWERLIREEDLTADVLVLPHHGAATPSLAPLLEATDPGVAVLSFGRPNAYGHPVEQTLETVAARPNCRIMCTEVAGACHQSDLGAPACAGTVRFDVTGGREVRPDIAEHGKVIDTLASPVCRTGQVGRAKA
jgi:competence protein ComEC